MLGDMGFEGLERHSASPALCNVFIYYCIHASVGILDETIHYDLYFESFAP